MHRNAAPRARRGFEPPCDRADGVARRRQGIGPPPHRRRRTLREMGRLNGRITRPTDPLAGAHLHSGVRPDLLQTPLKPGRRP